MMIVTNIPFILCTAKLVFAVYPLETDFPDYNEEYLDEESRVVRSGFPVAIVCAEPLLYQPSYLEEDIEMNSENDDNVVETPYFDQEDSNIPLHNESVQCIISRDGVVIYNETIIWRNRFTNGSFEYADDDWDNSQVCINLTWGEHETSDYHFTIVLKSPDEDVCAIDDSDNESRTKSDIGLERELKCVDTDDVQHLSKDQYDSLSVSWWKGCEKIERNDSNFEYVAKSYKLSGIEYDSLKISNLSLHVHPGDYHCVIERETENGTVIRYVHKSQKLCLQQTYTFSNQPDIKPSSEEYIVQPGANLTITATGQTGSDPNTPSLSVHLHKLNPTLNEWSLICDAVNSQFHSNSDCTLRVHQNAEFCKILTADEIHAIDDHRVSDNYTATFNIRDAKEEDEGTYRLSIYTTKQPRTANFTVKVQYPPGTPQWLVITLSLVGVFVVIAMAALILLHIYSIEIRYFKKKLLDGEIQGTKPMAYLLYYPDATEDGDPVDAVRRFIAGRRFLDDNNANGAPELNPAGHLLADHKIHMLRQCMSLVIFVTPAMLNGNDIEIFVAYQGFAENIQNELPIIFITTSETRSIFKSTSNEENPTVAAFRDFMRRGKNRVIHWDERHPNRFRRALYAFLPKVAYPGVKQEENENMV